MSELVARLRRMQSLTIIGGSLAGEAADEIESLRQQLADSMELAHQVIEKRDTEIKMLRGIVENVVEINPPLPMGMIEAAIEALAATEQKS